MLFMKIKIGRTDITFDTFKNQIWQLRFMALENFIQAVRKVNEIKKKKVYSFIFLLLK